MNRSDILLHLRVAFPMAFQSSVIAIGLLILQFVINRLGTIPVAAYTAAQKIDSFAMLPLNSIGVAMATYAAQNYGAREIKRIRQGVSQSLLFSIGFSLFMGVVDIFEGDRIAGIFVESGETEVLSLAHTYLIINGSMYFILACLLIYRFTLQGLGKSFAPTIAGIMELVMRSSGALVLVHFWGFKGAAISNPLAWLGATIPLAVTYYATMRKMDGLVTNI